MRDERVLQRQKQKFNTLIGLIGQCHFDQVIDEFKQESCSICFEEFQPLVFVRKIPICQHVFHSECIDNWFKTQIHFVNSLTHSQTQIQEVNQNCPICKADINIRKVKEAQKKNSKQNTNRGTIKIMPAESDSFLFNSSQSLSLLISNNNRMRRSQNPMEFQIEMVDYEV